MPEGSIPDKLPSWLRSGDWVIVRLIVVACLWQMMPTLHFG